MLPNKILLPSEIFKKKEEILNELYKEIPESKNKFIVLIVNYDYLLNNLIQYLIEVITLLFYNLNTIYFVLNDPKLTLDGCILHSIESLKKDNKNTMLSLKIVNEAPPKNILQEYICIHLNPEYDFLNIKRTIDKRNNVKKKTKEDLFENEIIKKIVQNNIKYDDKKGFLYLIELKIESTNPGENNQTIMFKTKHGILHNFIHKIMNKYPTIDYLEYQNSKFLDSNLFYIQYKAIMKKETVVYTTATTNKIFPATFNFNNNNYKYNPSIQNREFRRLNELQGEIKL